MYIPLWTIPSQWHGKHLNAGQFFHDSGCGYSQMCQQFVLKQAYAHVFLKMMETPLVATASVHGWKPVMLIKNILLQRSQHGLRGQQFSTQEQPGSYLHLAGFFKGKTEDNSLRIIILQNGRSDSLMFADLNEHA
jgi:hypothetical protein